MPRMRKGLVADVTGSAVAMAADRALSSIKKARKALQSAEKALKGWFQDYLVRSLGWEGEEEFAAFVGEERAWARYVTKSRKREFNEMVARETYPNAYEDCCTGFDAERFREKYPDLYEECMTKVGTGGSVRFQPVKSVEVFSGDGLDSEDVYSPRHEAVVVGASSGLNEAAADGGLDGFPSRELSDALRFAGSLLRSARDLDVARVYREVGAAEEAGEKTAEED
jgi:hypothetical protein